MRLMSCRDCFTALAMTWSVKFADSPLGGCFLYGLQPSASGLFFYHFPRSPILPVEENGWRVSVIPAVSRVQTDEHSETDRRPRAACRNQSARQDFRSDRADSAPHHRQ